MPIAGAEKASPETAPQLEVRRLAYSDLPVVLSIERRSFPAPWSISMFAHELSKPSSVCLAAVEAVRVVGYLVCTRYHDVWHLMSVAVVPDRRRRGIAAELVTCLLAETRSAGARYTLEVRASNRAAIAMYEGMGFRRAGVRNRYYSDNGEDALIMWRDAPAVAEAPAAVEA